MYTRVLGVTISVLILASGVGVAIAQDRITTPQPEQTQPHPMGQDGMMGQGMGGGMGHGMMDHGMMEGMMGHDMMGRGMAGPPPVIFRVMFALIDTDSDGTISLQEFQAAHERIFKAMDTNKDGKLTLEEMQAFIHPEH
jgi:hypothetical protein